LTRRGLENGFTAPALDPTTVEKKYINHIIILGIGILIFDFELFIGGQYVLISILPW